MCVARVDGHVISQFSFIRVTSIFLVCLFALSTPWTIFNTLRGPRLRWVMVAVVLLAEGSLWARLTQKPSRGLTRKSHVLPAFHMRGPSLQGDGVPPRVTQLEGPGHVAALSFPGWRGWPCLGALLNLHGPRPSLPSWLQASTYRVSSARSPFLGLGPLAAEILLALHWWSSLWFGQSLDPTTPPTLSDH